MKLDEETVVADCAIDGAAYAMTIMGLLPTILCACGKQFQGQTWEEAGALYDEHLQGSG